MIEWWGWLIIGVVVWFMTAVAVAWWWANRRGRELQAIMLQQINRPLNDLPPAFGPYDRQPPRLLPPEHGPAFGPRHRP